MSKDPKSTYYDAGGAFVKDEDERKQDGGPAFPEGRGVGEVWLSEGGMTLRDYFAAKVMQAIRSGPERQLLEMKSIAAYNDDDVDGVIAHFSYKMADAMLKERNK